MSHVTSELLEFNPKEPIPGYRTTELIGRGGSGEVWRAVAPGGLAKDFALAAFARAVELSPAVGLGNRR